jgi:cell division septum initiation protein DivIVA
VNFNDLSDDQRAALDTFVQKLGAARWGEVARWDTMFRAGTFDVSPPGFARYFGTNANLELGLHLTGESASIPEGVRLRLIVGAKHSNDHGLFQLYPGEHLADALDAIIALAPAITVEDSVAMLVPALNALCDPILFEMLPGQFVRLELNPDVPADANMYPTDPDDAPDSESTPTTAPAKNLRFEPFALPALDDMDWSRLKHAYGGADDIPDLLNDLASGDEDRINNALYELYGTIWHQGTIYSATPHAVPPLITIAERVPPPLQAKILELLAFLTGGDGESLERVRAEVEKGVPLYLQALSSENVNLRRAAVLVLSRCPNARDQIAPALRERYAVEDDETIQQNILLALGMIRDATDETRKLIEQAISERETFISIAAAAAGVQLFGDKLPMAGEVLMESFERPDMYFEDPDDTSEYENNVYASLAFPWQTDSYIGDFLPYLRFMGAPSEQLVDYLLGFLEDDERPTNENMNTSIVEMILEFTFPDSTVTTAAELSARQREVLTELSRDYYIWDGIFHLFKNAIGLEYVDQYTLIQFLEGKV